jgi:hypothetical protein
VGTLSSNRDEFKAAEPSMRGVKSPVGTLSSNRGEFKAAPPCIPAPPCAPPYASAGAVGVGTGVFKAGAGTLSDTEPGVGMLSEEAAYPLSPPVSEGGTREGVLASEVDIDEAASPKGGIPNAAGSGMGMGTACGVGCTSPPRSRACVGTAFTLAPGSATPGCEGRRPEVGRGWSRS